MKKLEELGISPAPWKTDMSIEDEAWVEDAKGNDILRLAKYERRCARLIAAAPKLYEYLREAVVKACGGCTFNSNYPEGDGECKAKGWYAECFIAKWRAVLKEVSGESEVVNGEH